MSSESDFSGKRRKVALVCDFVEEGWPSMDLIGDMLFQYLSNEHRAELAAAQIRPPLRQTFSRLPFLGTKLAMNADRMLNRFVNYPRYLRGRSGQFDLYHLVDHSYAQLVHELPPDRTIVTCHDLDTFRCLIEPEREHRPLWFRRMTRRILEGFQKSARVIAVSATTAAELKRHDLFPSERIDIVPNGVHPSCSPLPDPVSDAAVAGLLQEYPADTLWLLSVGSNLQRKRLDILLRVFASVHKERPGLRLVRVGGNFTPELRQLAIELGVEKAVKILPFLDRDILSAVYRKAFLLLHTAEAEGFGLPVVEAMACGCPVVASDIPVLREIGGTAAAYCPVGDVNVWRQTVLEMHDENSRRQDLWEQRRVAAIERSSHFSWSENARKTAQIYQDVLNGRDRSTIEH